MKWAMSATRRTWPGASPGCSWPASCPPPGSARWRSVSSTSSIDSAPPGMIVAKPESAWRQSLAAARANFLPGLALQAAALALVLAYYFHPAAHAALDALAEQKLRHGWRFSLVSTALC